MVADSAALECPFIALGLPHKCFLHPFQKRFEFSAVGVSEEMSDAVVNGLAGAGGGIVSLVLTYPLLAVSANSINFLYEDILAQLAQAEDL